MAAARAASAAAPSERYLFAHSITEVPATVEGATPANRHAHLLRANLLDKEMSASMTFEIALRMPHFDELQARLASGQRIAPSEMASRYYPAASDYQAVIDWVNSQGLQVTRTDSNHLAVFGRGSVSQVAAAFQTTFGRVTTDDGVYTSALSAPSLPMAIASPVLGIHGLQPHIRFRPHMSPRVQPRSNPIQDGYYQPADVASHYQASALATINGTGQTIAIFAGAYAADSDLAGYWNFIGLTPTPTVQKVSVGNGPGANPDQAAVSEATLDEEWVGGLAPGATVRVYAGDDTDPNFFTEILQQIAADLPSNPTLHVLSISYGVSESSGGQDYAYILSQYCANLASAGVSIFAASGDGGGSTAGETMPASDPNVTGVGGTTISGGDIGWAPSGGGPSIYFKRPSWQVGAGIVPGAMRLVPDVSAVADPNSGAGVEYQGVLEATGGTSWSAPIWAAFTAIINQYRATKQTPAGPVGNLNTWIYTLNQTTAISDVTMGSNGVFNCGVGYDEITGLGTPNVVALAQASLQAPGAPAIYSQFNRSTVTTGVPGTFYVVATGAATLTYQWQRQAYGTSTWTSLTDGVNYQGSATQMLRVLGTGSAGAMNGDQFQCVVTNASGSATSAPAPLIVNSTGVTTLAGWPGSWGSVDGTGFAARFGGLGAIKGDGAGNVYVADGGNTIRKVTAAGVVTTVAGQAGVAGNQDGPVATATLNNPAGIAFDQQGNLCFVDWGNKSVRKVIGGVLSTFVTGFTDPQDLAIDSHGNLYVPDGSSNTIKVISPAGVVSVFAGSGTAGLTDGPNSTAQFSHPECVAIDAADNVYVGDLNNNAVRKISATGGVTTLATGLDGPTGVTLDSVGNVFVCGLYDGTIRMISPSGIVTLLAGIPGQFGTVDGTPLAAEFAAPNQVYWDPQSSILYVADTKAYENQHNGLYFDGATLRTLVVDIPTLPTITTQPVSVTLTSNGVQNASFTVAASANAALTYQWQVQDPSSSAWTNVSTANTLGASGQSSPTLTIYNATTWLSNNSYRCQVSDAEGSSYSAAATLMVAGQPEYVPVDQDSSVPPGNSVTLYANGRGENLTYQWELNGNIIAGATGPSYSIPDYSAANAGFYEVFIYNSFGFVDEKLATLTTQSARLINLSARSVTGGGSSALAAGFSIGGSGSKSLLLRGPGPTLANFNVTDVLPDPVLTLYSANQAILATNQGWANNAAVAAAIAASEAFGFPPGSADSALLEKLPVGINTIQVQGASGDSGAAMAEIYDLDPIDASARLVNISSRSLVSPTSVLIAGFVIGGSGSETVLIRGVGPELAQYGISNPLAHPVLTLYDHNNNIMDTNSGWNNATSLSTAFGQVGAFSLPANSLDAAMLVTLPAGNYTAEVTSYDNSAGVALIEVYEVL